MRPLEEVTVKKEDNAQESRLGKKTSMQNLYKKVKEYIKRAKDIVGEKIDSEKMGAALTRLYRYISLENGGYADDVHNSIMNKEKLYIDFLNQWHLYADDEEWSEGEILVSFLKAAESAIGTRGGAFGFSGEFFEVPGWEWHPATGIDAASVVLWALLDAIYRYLEYLRVQVEIETGKDMGCHIAKKKALIMTPYYNIGKDGVEVFIPEVARYKRTEKQEETWSKRVMERKYHLCIDKRRAKQLYKALCAEDIGWLAEEMPEEEFVNQLTLPPSEKKIKLHQLNQVYYVTKKVLFYDKARVAPEEWDLIRQLFDAKDGKMNRVNKSSKHPKNHKIFDQYMGIGKENSESARRI